MPAKNKSAAAKKPRKKTVNAKHKIEFTAPTVVDDPSIVSEDEEGDVEIEENEEGGVEAEALMDFEDDGEVEIRRAPTLRQRLRSRFEKRGIGGSEIMTLRIDRLPSFEQDGLASVKADRQFCGIISCTEDIFDGDEYMTRIQQSYGPGTYWLTLRHKNSIVQQWRESIGGFVGPASENGQPSPTIVYGQPPHQQAQAPDALGQLRAAFRLVKEFREDLGLVMPQSQTPPSLPPAPLDPEVVLLQGLASNDKFMDKIQTGTIKKLFGDNAAVDDEPSITAVLMEAVKTGQADRSIIALGNVFLRLVDRVLPNWNQSGQAQPAQTQAQDQGQAPAQNGAHAQPGQLPQGDVGASGRQVDGGYTAPNASAYEGMPPQQQALMILLDDCRMRLPPQIAYDKLMDLAEAIYDQAPAFSIYPYLAYFGEMTIDDALEFVKTQPGGEEVAALAHAKPWTEALQNLIKESRQEDDEA